MYFKKSTNSTKFVKENRIHQATSLGDKRLYLFKWTHLILTFKSLYNVFRLLFLDISILGIAY